ncbi:hypothetical protein IFM89_019527 [Coptis chinensis]|uniref:Uncharacterized protein n=1 Tax=Coptis chinensis TaxID=261450 RepID=A0A835M423_9MAGN|nr:hypothetical protein IFM89_019527 [Coptis chinensis]
MLRCVFLPRAENPSIFKPPPSLLQTFPPLLPTPQPIPISTPILPTPPPISTIILPTPPLISTPILPTPPPKISNPKPQPINPNPPPTKDIVAVTVEVKEDVHNCLVENQNFVGRNLLKWIYIDRKEDSPHEDDLKVSSFKEEDTIMVEVVLKHFEFEDPFAEYCNKLWLPLATQTGKRILEATLGALCLGNQCEGTEALAVAIINPEQRVVNGNDDSGEMRLSSVEDNGQQAQQTQNEILSLSNINSESRLLHPFMEGRTLAKSFGRSNTKNSKEILKVVLRNSQKTRRYDESKRPSPGGPDPQHHAMNQT